jgi:hypothetical protein
MEGIPQNAAPRSSTVRFFLRDDVLRQWCGYSSQQTWATRVKSVHPEMMGSVEFSNTRLSRIFLRQTDSTGDWVLDDRYDLDRKGEFARLLRVIGYLSENELKQESYGIGGGRATRKSSSASNLTTHDSLPLPRALDDYETWPVYTRIRDFPFAPLLKGLTNSGLRDGELCVPQ